MPHALIMTAVICEESAGFYFCGGRQKCVVVGKPVNPKCGLRVECVGNRHDDRQ